MPYPAYTTSPIAGSSGITDPRANSPFSRLSHSPEIASKDVLAMSTFAFYKFSSNLRFKKSQ